MKPARAITCAAALLCVPACVVIPPGNIVAAKATVFGLDVSSDPVSGVPHLRFGLVRYFYQRIPTDTNVLHAAPFANTVDATAGLASSRAVETFSTK